MSMPRKNFKQWRQNGEHWVWLSAMAVSTCLIMITGILLLLAVRGLGYFWPGDVVEFHYKTQQGIEILAGEFVKEESIADEKTAIRTLYKIGNREQYGLDFRWIRNDAIIEKRKSLSYVVVERTEWGNAYGKLESFTWQGRSFKSDDTSKLNEAIEEIQDLRHDIEQIERYDIGSINHQFENLRRKKKKLIQNKTFNSQVKLEIKTETAELEKEYELLNTQLTKRHTVLETLGKLDLVSANGKPFTVHFNDIIRFYTPNQMHVGDKLIHYIRKIWEFVSESPREANTEGGVFPAIFGTVILVLLMTVFVTPFGVIAAVYLKEYAKQGLVVRLIRISVNNLAGVPSIVYGVFGLGFFVYFIGGSIDDLFYSHAFPSPTFGSPGLLWASLTLALLTLPVVIVSTEEGLSRVPSSIREGSLALGATQFETLMRTVLPMTSPAIMTGLILAIARAAGEVAPLMLVGVVKLAPDLAVDSTAPFLHLDRQFMHLGFHIFDVGFQSPNVEAARPLVYATAFLLVLIILILNLTAIYIRNNLREKYKSFESS